MTAGLFIIALLVCLFLGIPIFIAMMIPSTYYLLNVLNMQPIMAVSSFTAGLNKFSTLCLPFFILAASVMGKGQIGSRLLKFCRSIVGHMYGGIGMTAIVCCIIIGAISGASTAGILIIGALIYQEMIDNGYPRGFSAGLICTVSSVGMLIPPGIAFVVYAMNTNTSVLKLFMGGLSSGIVMAAIFMVYVYVYARRHKVPRLPRISLKEFFTAVKEAIWALGLPVIIIGTMYTGICTPTEAAAISAVYAIFVEMVIYKDVDFKTLIDICGDCAKTVCTIYILLAAGQLLGYVMTLARIPQLMEAMLGSTSRLMILLVINIMFLIAGGRWLLDCNYHAHGLPVGFKSRDRPYIPWKRGGNQSGNRYEHSSFWPEPVCQRQGDEAVLCRDSEVIHAVYHADDFSAYNYYPVSRFILVPPQPVG